MITYTSSTIATHFYCFTICIIIINPTITYSEKQDSYRHVNISPFIRELKKELYSSIDVNLNYYDVDPAFGEDYLDWSVGGTLSFDGFDIDLRYVDTDISNCAGVCDGRAVFSISRTF